MSSFSSSSSKRPSLLAGIALIALFAGAGFYSLGATANPAEEAPAAAAQHPGAPAGAPEVSVVTVEPRAVQVWSSFSARLHAVDYAEIRPEVSGRITDVRFEDGQTVKAGDVLFVIDVRAYEAAVAKAEANLASAKTNAGYARKEKERAANLVKTQAIAARLYDERDNADRVAQAAILAAEAELKQARLDLDHAYVKAPIAGKVGRAEITEGNLVQAGPGAPLLTSIVSSDGIYADFEIDEQTYMKNIRAAATTADAERQIPVELTVQGGEDHPYKGTIHSFDNRIDTASGTIRARARFDNADGSLMPGMFVSVRLANTGTDGVLLVPEHAVGNDQSKKFVMIVGDDDKAAYRTVTLGAATEGQRIVLTGLNAGDRVIVDGLQQVRPDTKVTVRDAAPAAPQ